MSELCEKSCTYFNSHAHVERDLRSSTESEVEVNFNSHAHVERDQDGRLFHQRSPNFNSHAHVERDDRWLALWQRAMHFNSHAHVERDFMTILRTIGVVISTHTLTWSVTEFLFSET